MAASTILASAVPLISAQAGEFRAAGGRLTLKRRDDGSLLRPVTRATTNGEGGVISARAQRFYLDKGTDADFVTDDDGRITEILVRTGGLLSLFGPSEGKGVTITTPNATGAIRGTTTYFAWQEAETRTYVCCCYGGVDLENAGGGGTALRTSYHNAVVLPDGGGVEPAPYPAPLNHYDDDIARLEQHAGRSPRWQLPGDKMNFFAPEPVPLN